MNLDLRDRKLTPAIFGYAEALGQLEHSLEKGKQSRRTPASSLEVIKTMCGLTFNKGPKQLSAEKENHYNSTGIIR